MAELLKGAPVAAAIAEDLSARIAALKEKGVSPKLAVIRLGERGGDLFYERAVLRYAGKVGAECLSFVMEETTPQEELIALIEHINEDDAIHGCLLLRPVPKHMDAAAVCEALRPEKDLDGMGTRALGAPPAPPAPAWRSWSIIRSLWRARASWCSGAVSSSASPSASCCWRRTPRSRSATAAAAICPPSAARRTC